MVSTLIMIVLYHNIAKDMNTQSYETQNIVDR